jgi:hypothetical protein
VLALSSAFFTDMVSTPSFILADTLLGSTGRGNQTDRVKDMFLVNGRSADIWVACSSFLATAVVVSFAEDEN